MKLKLSKKYFFFGNYWGGIANDELKFEYNIRCDFRMKEVIKKETSNNSLLKSTNSIA